MRTVQATQGTDNTPCLMVDGRYLIYLDDGTVYDTIHAKDIPQDVFEIRDIAMTAKLALEGGMKMNREILFRGKRVDTGEWVEGNLITGVFTYLGQDIPYILCADKADYDCFEDFTEWNGIFEVIPETVGQYTGLTDKNDTKIFDGDIIKEFYENENNEYDYDNYDVGYVFCYPETTRFLRNSKMSSDNTYAITGWKEYEVIGNIHDNADLLEVQK